jgi:hypothetical protein
MNRLPILVAVFALSVALACVTLPSGDREVDRSECIRTANMVAEAGRLGCPMISEDPDDVEICNASVETARGAAVLGCQFAKEHPDE